MLAFISPLTLTSTLASVFVRGLAGGLTGIIVAALAYSFLNNREFAETVSEIRGRLWRGSTKREGGASIVASAEEAVELK